MSLIKISIPIPAKIKNFLLANEFLDWDGNMKHAFGFRSPFLTLVNSAYGYTACKLFLIFTVLVEFPFILKLFLHFYKFIKQISGIMRPW